VTLRLTDAAREQMLRDGLTLDRTLTPRDGATRLHIVVRDAPTGTTGSLTIPMDRVRDALR
jgi:hypothetical protein